MKLQERSLTRQMQGEDVKLLQDDLRQLGWNIPEWETEEDLIYNDQIGVSSQR